MVIMKPNQSWNNYKFVEMQLRSELFKFRTQVQDYSAQIPAIKVIENYQENLTNYENHLIGDKPLNRVHKN